MRVRTCFFFLLIALLVALPAQAFAATWNLATDYVARANPSLPVVKDASGNDVWYFKLGSSAINPATYAATGLTWATGGDPLFSWMPATATDLKGWVRNPGGLPHVSVNTGADVWSVTSPSFLWKANKVLSHPMPATDSAPYSVIEWKAPRAGSASFAVTLTDVDVGGGDGFEYWVLKNATVLDSGTVANAAPPKTPALADVAVVAGDSIYVVLGPGAAGHSWDSTQMDVAITLPDPPTVSTPASADWSIAALALMGVALIVSRRTIPVRG